MFSTSPGLSIRRQIRRPAQSANLWCSVNNVRGQTKYRECDVLTLTVARGTADIGVTAGTKSSSSIASRKTVLQTSIVNQPLRACGLSAQVGPGHRCFLLGLGKQDRKRREVTILAVASVVTALVIDAGNLGATSNTVLDRIARCSNGAFWYYYASDTTSHGSNHMCAYRGLPMDYLEPPDGFEEDLSAGQNQ